METRTTNEKSIFIGIARAVGSTRGSLRNACLRLASLAKRKMEGELHAIKADGCAVAIILGHAFRRDER